MKIKEEFIQKARKASKIVIIILILYFNYIKYKTNQNLEIPEVSNENTKREDENAGRPTHGRPTHSRHGEKRRKRLTLDDNHLDINFGTKSNRLSLANDKPDESQMKRYSIGDEKTREI